MFIDNANARSHFERPPRATGRRAGGKIPAMGMRSLGICGAALVLVVSVCAMAADPAPPKIDAAAMATLVQSFDKVEVQEHSWGWLRWLMNSKLDPKAEMTFGLVEINAGQRNPMHVHPNCEEQLYVLSGSCEHVLGKQTCVLKAGDVIRIPAGVPHYARTFDKEPMRAVIVYSSGDRQFVVVDEKPAKK